MYNEETNINQINLVKTNGSNVKNNVGIFERIVVGGY